jgi:hypothetical protein
MKLISAHQPNYLPWAGFFSKIILSEKFVILDEVQYSKNSWINRNLLQNKLKPYYITVPVKNHSTNKKKINEVEIDSDAWKKKHLNSIYFSYKKSEYFKKYYPQLENEILKKSQNLCDLNLRLIYLICKFLNINEKKILLQSDLKTSQKKLDLIIEICKKLDCDGFFFGELGKNYCDEEKLKKENITPIFQKFILKKYSKIDTNKLNLSILDLIFNCGENSKNTIIESHKNFFNCGND